MNQAPRFQPGDVVRLKSGGPEMTVCSTEHHRPDHNKEVLCTWFPEGAYKPEEWPFGPEALENARGPRLPRGIQLETADVES